MNDYYYNNIIAINCTPKPSYTARWNNVAADAREQPTRAHSVISRRATPTIFAGDFDAADRPEFFVSITHVYSWRRFYKYKSTKLYA